MMEVQFNGKRALVTGVGKGLGRAVAITLFKYGATVHGISRSQEDLDSLKKEVPDIHVHNVDLSDWEKTRHVVQEMGPIDLLVNNAAISVQPGSILEVKQEELIELFSINTHAVYNVSQVVAKGMVERGQGGSIVNVGSTASIKPVEGMSIYCMSKAAVDMLTKCMALELGKHKIRVNSVNPTSIRTPMFNFLLEANPGVIEGVKSRTPGAKYPAEINDVVDSILFLLSDKASMITGSLLPVDSGLLIG